MYFSDESNLRYHIDLDNFFASHRLLDELGCK